MKKKLKHIWNLFENIPLGVKAALTYTFSSILIKGFNIITVPIFTRLMSSEEIGVFYNFSSWLTLLSVFVSLALTSGGINVLLVEFENEKDSYQSSIMSLITIVGTILLLIFGINSEFFSKILDMNVILLMVMAVAFILEPAKDIWMARQRLDYKYKNVFVFSVLSTILSSLAAVIATILAKNNNISSLGTVRVTVSYLVLFIFDGYLLIKIFRNGKTLYNKVYWSCSLKLSIPLIFHSLGKNILDVSDRTMITKLCGNNVTGVYSTLYNLSSLSLIVWNAINSTFVPFLFNKLKKNESNIKDEVSKVVNPLMFVYGVVCVIITLISPEIIKILTTPEYYSAISIMPPIAGGIFLTCLYNLFADVLTYYKKTKYIMVSTLTAALINILLNLLFIPRYGYIAAAYTTLAAYIVLSCIQGIAMFTACRARIYNIKVLSVFSVIIVALCLMCNLIYQFTFLRYAIVLCLIGLLIIFRKKIISTFKMSHSRF